MEWHLVTDVSHVFIINIELNWKKQWLSIFIPDHAIFQLMFESLFTKSKSQFKFLYVTKMRRWINPNKPRHQHHQELYFIQVFIPLKAMKVYARWYNSDRLCNLYSTWNTDFHKGADLANIYV